MNCNHQDKEHPPIYWNSYNNVFQCHRCGEVFTPVGKVKELVRLIKMVTDELGVTQPNYPAPVGNANKILRDVSTILLKEDK